MYQQRGEAQEEGKKGPVVKEGCERQKLERYRKLSWKKSRRLGGDATRQRGRKETSGQKKV